MAPWHLNMIYNLFYIWMIRGNNIFFLTFITKVQVSRQVDYQVYRKWCLNIFFSMLTSNLGTIMFLTWSTIANVSWHIFIPNVLLEYVLKFFKSMIQISSINTFFLEYTLEFKLYKKKILVHLVIFIEYQS